MSWFDRFARALYEVYENNFSLYVCGATCTIIVLITLLIIIMKFVPCLFIIALTVGVAVIMVIFIKAIANNMKDDID